MLNCLFLISFLINIARWCIVCITLKYKRSISIREKRQLNFILYGMILISIACYSCKIGFKFKNTTGSHTSNVTHEFLPTMYLRFFLGAFIGVMFIIIWIFLIMEQNKLIKETRTFNGKEITLKQ